MLIAGLDDYVEDPETEDKEPNCLELTAIQGKQLLIMDTGMFSTGGSSDPFVRFRIPGFKDQQTAYIRKTINPIWNEKITFSPFVDASQTLQVTVKDYNDVTTSKFMGRIYISLLEFADKRPKKQWFKLEGENGADGVSRGEIELLVHWKFDLQVGLSLIRSLVDIRFMLWM
jgi:Ca2+-dependent lipid-binding protein